MSIHCSPWTFPCNNITSLLLVHTLTTNPNFNKWTKWLSKLPTCFSIPKKSKWTNTLPLPYSMRNHQIIFWNMYPCTGKAFQPRHFIETLNTLQDFDQSVDLVWVKHYKQMMIIWKFIMIFFLSVIPNNKRITSSPHTQLLTYTSSNNLRKYNHI